MLLEQARQGLHVARRVDEAPGARQLDAEHQGVVAERVAEDGVPGPEEAAQGGDVGAVAGDVADAVLGLAEPGQQELQLPVGRPLACRDAAGRGGHAEAGGRLMENLGAPEEIDAICLTHLHPDHIGWLLADGKAAFPSATIYLSETENASTSQWEATSPLLARWQQVKEAYAGKIVTFADNAALFDGRVQTLPAPGHTPGHTLFQIGNCLIAGDILHSQDLQLDNPYFCARYDQDPTTAVATRKQILEYVRNNHLQLCGAHCYVPFIKLN